jgi:PEGA domain
MAYTPASHVAGPFLAVLFASGVALAEPAATAPTSAAVPTPATPPAPTPSSAAPVPSAKPAAATRRHPPLAQALTGTAKADYDAARVLYENGDFPGALQKLKSSYDASQDPRLLWNMAACEKNLRHYASILDLIDRYLADGTGYVTDKERAEATALATTVRAFVTELTLTVNEEGAAVSFDDQPKGTTPLTGPLRVDMGTHKLRVSKAGFVDFIATPDLPGGQPSELGVQLKAEIHQGKLHVIADPPDVIEVDGKVVGTGLWEGVLASGSHVVLVTGRGKFSHQTDVIIADEQTNMLHVALQDEPKQVVLEKGGIPAWAWVAGGALIAGGGVGIYFLTKPGDSKFQNGSQGNWGSLSL